MTRITDGDLSNLAQACAAVVRREPGGRNINVPAKVILAMATELRELRAERDQAAVMREAA